MRMRVIMQLMKMLYREYLRGLLVEAVESTNSEWDDQVLELVDLIFDYETD